MKRQFMRKQVINRVTALVLACLLAFPTPYPVSAAETEYKISSAEELMDFAQKCSLDTWSQGKTFRLTKDIDLTGSAFTPIPTFGGTFLGNGHSITGLYLTDNGSKQGLFRNIQSGGTVSDLKVEGTVQPGGSHTNIGGIAGSNSGTIQNCNFKGSVKGETAVGGIAGVNQETGQINGSSVSGTVQGQNGIGGIAGKNLGILMKCENSANINTSEDAADLNVDTAEMLTQQTRATTVETMLEGHTDVGGVAGYSSGVVQSCTNLGEVGYQHIGYNVGGIVGRQTGYLAACMNSGNVMGRKDVGGIAGQAEPYIAMMPGEDRLAGLREELNTLDTLISKALDDAGAANDEVSVHLTNMGKITDNARDSSKMLADSGADFVNDNIEAINSISVTLVNALDSMTPAVEEMKNAAHWLNSMIGKLEEGLNELQIAPENAAILHAAVQEMNAAYNELVNVSGELDTAVKNLVSALTRNDSTSADAALKEIGTVLSKLGGFYRKRRRCNRQNNRCIEAGDAWCT